MAVRHCNRHCSEYGIIDDDDDDDDERSRSVLKCAKRDDERIRLCI